MLKWLKIPPCWLANSLHVGSLPLYITVHTEPLNLRMCWLNTYLINREHNSYRGGPKRMWMYTEFCLHIFMCWCHGSADIQWQYMLISSFPAHLVAKDCDYRCYCCNFWRVQMAIKWFWAPIDQFTIHIKATGTQWSHSNDSTDSAKGSAPLTWQLCGKYSSLNAFIGIVAFTTIMQLFATCSWGVWSRACINAKIEAVKFSSKAFLQKFGPAKIFHYTVSICKVAWSLQFQLMKALSQNCTFCT